MLYILERDPNRPPPPKSTGKLEFEYFGDRAPELLGFQVQSLPRVKMRRTERQRRADGLKDSHTVIQTHMCVTLELQN